MNDILITIFSLKENLYLAYWINVDDQTFQTVNFSELINQKEIELPFLSDIEKIANIFPDHREKDVFVSLIRDENLSVLIFTIEEEYLPINKSIFSLLQNNLLRTKKSEIESYLEGFFSDTVDPEIQDILSEMNQELINYSSFISVYEYESDRLVGSTLHKKKDENILAREVFKEIKRLELIKKINLEVELKKIGSLQVFYFYLKGLVFVVYCINIQVNTGIIRLKLKAFLKNKPFLKNFNPNQMQKKTLKIIEPDLSDNKIKTYKLQIRF